MVKNIKAISFFALSLSCSQLAMSSSGLDSSVDDSLNESGLRQQASFEGHLNSSDVKSEERISLISGRYKSALVENRRLTVQLEKLADSEKAADLRKKEVENRFKELLSKTRQQSKIYEDEKAVLDAQIKELKEKIAVLEGRNKADLLRADSAKADLKLAQDELAKVNVRLDDLNDANQLLNMQLKQKQDEATEEYADYECLLEESERNVAEHLAALELAQNDLRIAKEHLELSEATAASYFHKIDELNAAVVSKDATIAQLFNEKTRLLEQVAQLTTTTQEITKRVAELSTRVAADGTPQAITPKKTPVSRGIKALSDGTNRENVVAVQLGKGHKLTEELKEVLAKKSLPFNENSEKPAEVTAAPTSDKGYGLMTKVGATAVVGVAAYWAYNHFQSK